MNSSSKKTTKTINIYQKLYRGKGTFIDGNYKYKRECRTLA